MQKLHSPYIRIEITEVVETPGDSNRRESLYNLGYYEFQNGVNAGNGSNEWSHNFHNVLIPLLTDGWKIDNVIGTANPGADGEFHKNLYILA